jgi:hypothetical protein
VAAHLWWQILGPLLSRSGSRNAFDEDRNAGQAPWNLGELCGQTGDDPRFGDHPTVTCSDNAARQADRVDPELVAHIPVLMVRDLLASRRLEGMRLFDHGYVLVADGSVQEKCRQGFEDGGKTSSGEARYRYILQLSLLGPDGTLIPLMHESMDVENPETEKEDGELRAFERLSQRCKQEFPRLPFCLVADCLYACQLVVAICIKYHWKYVLTLKEGRQPTTWEEVLKLLPLHRGNKTRYHQLVDGQPRQQDFRWVEDVMLGEHQTKVILLGEVTPAPTATLYVYMTNFSNLTPERVGAIVNRAGRERHRIEDTFNTQKNHGIGWAHVFCARAKAAKNYYTMMPVAQILWIVTYQGGLRRLYDWARRATQKGLAQTLWEAMRAARLPPNLPPLGQIRFGFT